jgi:hypothetical protein
MMKLQIPMSLLLGAGFAAGLLPGESPSPLVAQRETTPFQSQIQILPRPSPEGIWDYNPRPFQLPSGIKESGNEYTVTGQPPLAVATQLLSQKLAVPISYEDAAWAADSDLTSARIVPGVPIPPFALPRVPAEHTFSFTLAPLNELRKADAASVIQSVIDSYQRSGSPGKFKAVPYGTGEFSIVAVSAADQSGKDIVQRSPLEKRITISAKKRSRMEAILEICTIVSDDTVHLGVDASAGVVSGSGYLNYLTNNTTQAGADNEPAREVLAKVMGPLPGASPWNSRLAWILRFTPRSKEATLVLYDVQAEIVHPDGSRWLAPLVWTSQLSNP